jgi:hypothetical protein
MNEIKWNFINDSYDWEQKQMVDTTGCPAKKGLYLAACGASKKATQLYWDKSAKVWYDTSMEGENGEPVTMIPYAWADLPDAPARPNK